MKRGQTVEPARMQKVHCIDHKCNVASVLADRIRRLVMRDKTERRDALTPSGYARAREVAITSAYGGFAESGYFFKDRLSVLRRSVISIDQHGQ